MKSLVLLGKGVARIGEPLLLGEPMTVLRPVFMASLGSVSWPKL